MTDVTAFGAVGDGVTKDTQAVQRAIDCGGVIAFPPGTYLCGTLYLRDDIALELAPGAVLLASPDQADYNTDDFAPDNHVYEMECVTGAHFIIARNCHNVTIRGGGRIDGNRAANLRSARSTGLLIRNDFMAAGTDDFLPTQQ